MTTTLTTTTTPATDLRPDTKLIYSGVLVTVVGSPEPWEEPFGRPDFFKVLARREDTQATGYLFFGPTGTVEVV